MHRVLWGKCLAGWQPAGFPNRAEPPQEKAPFHLGMKRTVYFLRWLFCESDEPGDMTQACLQVMLASHGYWRPPVIECEARDVKATSQET